MHSLINYYIVDNIAELILINHNVLSWTQFVVVLHATI